MRIVYMEKEKKVKKTQKEINKEKKKLGFNEDRAIFIDEYKSVERKEPVYIVEMSANEIQLVCFYLELEKRNGIKTKLKLPSLRREKNE